mgnify:CR=1 FL=1
MENRPMMLTDLDMPERLGLARVTQALAGLSSEEKARVLRVMLTTALPPWIARRELARMDAGHAGD